MEQPPVIQPARQQPSQFHFCRLLKIGAIAGIILTVGSWWSWWSDWLLAAVGMFESHYDSWSGSVTTYPLAAIAWLLMWITMAVSVTTTVGYVYGPPLLLGSIIGLYMMNRSPANIAVSPRPRRLAGVWLWRSRWRATRSLLRLPCRSFRFRKGAVRVGQWRGRSQPL